MGEASGVPIEPPSQTRLLDALSELLGLGKALVREIRNMVALGERPAGAWKPPIVSTVAQEKRCIASTM